MEIWRPPLVSFVVAGVSTALLTPLAIRIARRLRVVDRPAPRKAHLRPVPLLGGLAVAAGAGVGAAAAAGVASLDGVALPLVGALGMLLLGLVDDVRELGVATKLVAQLAAAALCVAWARQEGGVTAAWALAGIGLWVVVVTNAFNLLDNHDGVVPAVGVVGGLGLVATGVLGGEQPQAAAAALAGACLGFFAFNRPPAAVFLGDSGSLVLGYALAVSAVGVVAAAPLAATVVAVACLFALPLVDTALVVLSRLRRGRNPLTAAGRDHAAHRLFASGLSRWRVLSTLVAVASGFAVTGLAVAAGGLGWRPVVIAVVLAATAAVVWLEALPNPEARAS